MGRLFPVLSQKCSVSERYSSVPGQAAVRRKQRSRATSETEETVTHVITSAMGSRFVSGVVRRVNGKPLRVLAYHDIVDANRFEKHLAHVRERYRPVCGSDVAEAARTGASLPQLAVWITFDDAHPGVIEGGLPLLERFGVPATLFVCPGMVDTTTPYWWQVLDTALSLGRPVEFEGEVWRDRRIVTRLKQEPDVVRRQMVAHVAEQLGEELGAPLKRRQITNAELERWVGDGRDLGNHTWDHPCLNTCPVGEQRRQIEQAHEALSMWAPSRHLLFAYPNGNATEASESVLHCLGYDVHALFDHKLCRSPGSRMSRLRIDADASPQRMRAILSGSHSAVYGTVRRARKVPLMGRK